MKFDYASDLHVDFHRTSQINWEEEVNSKKLIIAGDTANSPEVAYMEICKASQVYDRVIVVSGNHEYYSGRARRVHEIARTFQRLVEDIPNVTLLTTGRIWASIGHDTGIFGCNGWYDWAPYQDLTRERNFRNWKAELNDSRQIQFDIFPDKMAEIESMELEASLDEAVSCFGINKAIVVTHTLPLMVLAAKPPYPYYYLNPSYVNTLMGEIVKKWNHVIKVWVHGHSHFPCDVTFNGIRFLRNPRGYPNENRDWKIESFEIEE